MAKLYVPERESTAIRLLLEEEDEVFVSELARVELMSVFHRRLREKRWSQAQFKAAVRQFTNDDVGGFWSWLPLDSTIVDAAAKTYTTLPVTLFLRSSDCLHLVTALHHHFSEIYTYDHHQATAAANLGVKAVTA